MIVDLAALEPGVQVLAADEEVAFEDADGSQNRISCHIELGVRKTEEAVYIHAVVSGVFRTACHGCLEPAEVRIDPAFDVVVKKSRGGSHAQPVADDADLVYIRPDEREISLDAQVYENLISSIPIRILCREDCKGLCPGCGVNLNIEPCRCTENENPNRKAPGKTRDTELT